MNRADGWTNLLILQRKVVGHLTWLRGMLPFSRLYASLTMKLQCGPIATEKRRVSSHATPSRRPPRSFPRMAVRPTRR